jgi:hypothetical protein
VGLCGIEINVKRDYLCRDIEGTIWDVEVANYEDEAGGHGLNDRCCVVQPVTTMSKEWKA